MLVFIYRQETALQRQILGTCIHGIQLEKRAFQMEGSDARMNTIHTKEMRSQKNCLTQSLFILVLNFQGHFSGTPTQTFRIVAIKYCPQKGKKKKKKIENQTNRDFSCGPVVKTLPANAENVGSIPAPRRFHMPWGN